MSAYKRILVVEDEVMIAMHIEDTLVGLGHVVISAAAQKEAETIISDHPIDLAIVDYHLTDGTSAHLAEKLHDLGVPFIVCSGSSSLAELDTIFHASAFLGKPFTTDGLIEAVGRVTGLPSNEASSGPS